MLRSTRRAVGEAAERILSNRWANPSLTVLGVVAVAIGAVASPIAAAIFGAGAVLALAVISGYALLVRHAYAGPYDIISTETIWDMCEPDAGTVKITMRRHVRFNFRCTVVVDRAWGDFDDPFSDLGCEHGEVVYRGKRGPDHIALVLLKPERQRSDETNLLSQFSVANTFRGTSEWVEFGVNKVTKSAMFEVRFPASRPPRNVRLLRDSTGRTTDVYQKKSVTAAERDGLLHDDGRTVFRVIERPKENEKYTLNWEWAPLPPR